VLSPHPIVISHATAVSQLKSYAVSSNTQNCMTEILNPFLMAKVPKLTLNRAFPDDTQGSQPPLTKGMPFRLVNKQSGCVLLVCAPGPHAQAHSNAPGITFNSARLLSFFFHYIYIMDVPSPNGPDKGHIADLPPPAQATGETLPEWGVYMDEVACVRYGPDVRGGQAAGHETVRAVVSKKNGGDVLLCQSGNNQEYSQMELCFELFFNIPILARCLSSVLSEI
jgi:hypothetical protein